MSNVVLLMSDQHNPFYSEPYGHPFVRTPNMRRLAESGVVFENAYTPCPLCMPARASFFSGRRVHQNQTYNNCKLLLPSHPTYGRILAEQGVYSVHLGKVHGHEPGKEMGFSRMMEGGEETDPIGDTEYSRRPMTVRRGAAARSGQIGPKADPWPNDRLMVAEGVRWLREVAPGMKHPWTLAVNIVAPHFPLYSWPDCWEMYADHADLPRFGRDCPTADHPYAHDLRYHFDCGKFTDDQVRGLRRGYYACVTMVDRQLGMLMDALADSGVADDTVIAYTSDHGEMLGKFGMWWKCSLYEDSVRVPLIVSGPDFGHGQRVATPVDLLDLQATLFAATGARRPAEWIGQPLQSIPENDRDRAVFSEYHGHGTRSGAYLIRKGVWKLIHSMEAPSQLFNLADDPDELNNLFDREPGKARELEADLRRICSPEKENDRAHAFEQRQLEKLKEKPA